MPTAQHSTAPGMARVQRSSTVDLITVQLRNAIYEGLLLPGAQIHEAAVAEQLGVSRGSLRESAQRLVQDGLLVARPGQGLRVATVGVDDLEALYATRLAIEGAAIRTVASLGSVRERRRRLARALSLLDRLEGLGRQAVGPTSPRVIGDMDLELHFETVQAAGNQRLARFMSTLVMETRMASLGHPEGYIVRTDVHGVHRERLEFISAGKGDAAVAQLAAHFADTVNRLTGRLPGPVATALVDLAEGEQRLGPINA
ncbi:GntR family transcriptional regulator [Arthrobacter sp. JSM 101049]|uniref:GntR family transcriptional regulator n=1 Tax=Arthrobacter sp. JSM 101049 TaxID=929097 RepID=UPI00356962BC